MEAIIDGFFSAYDFGADADRAGLTYVHYDEVDRAAVFRVVRPSAVAEVEPTVAAAVEKLARTRPELASLTYRIDTE